MLKNVSIVLGGVFCFAATSSLALAGDYTVTCDQPKWNSPATMQGNNLPVTLTRNCKIVLNGSGSIASLQSHFMQNMYVENKVNFGPSSEIFRDLPSHYFEVTNTVSDIFHTTVMDLQAHVASDNDSQIILTLSSTKVSGTGEGQYLKSFKSEQTITKDPANDYTYYYTETQKVVVEKPWIAPSMIFIPECRQKFRTLFEKYSDKNVHSTANGLLNN